MNRVNAIFMALVGMVVLGACQADRAVQTAPVVNPMQPLEARRAVVGDQFVYLTEKSDQTSMTTREVSADRVAFEDESGCRFSDKGSSFAPSPDWSNCGGSAGTQVSRRLGGSIFPLAIGNSESWHYSGTNTNGDRWESKLDCTVPGVVDVTVPAGTFDTYYVRCEDEWWVREYYLNSDGVTVKWAQTSKGGSDDRNRSGDLVSFTPAST